MRSYTIWLWYRGDTGPCRTVTYRGLKAGSPEEAEAAAWGWLAPLLPTKLTVRISHVTETP